jgi:hypothetical protein
MMSATHCNLALLLLLLLPWLLLLEFRCMT